MSYRKKNLTQENKGITRQKSIKGKMDFVKNLIEARKKLGISQAELAKRLDVGQSTIAMWERGTREPKLSELEHIAKALNIAAARLIK